MRLSKAFLCILALACVVAALFFGSERVRDGNWRPRLNAQAALLINAIEELGFQYPERFREILLHQPATVLDYNLLSEATNALGSALGYRASSHGSLPSGLDVWEVPFRVEIRLTQVETNLTGMTEHIFQVKMWSCGPNRKDEQGFGDDIVFGPMVIRTE